MIPRVYRASLGALALMAALAILFPTAALAHERRAVGPYQVVVGFINEPALLGQPNGVDFRVTDASNQPVEGAEKSVRVAIAAGGSAAKELPLRARFGMKGAYTTDLVPTRAGAYVFRFTGTIDGTPIDERFESGPGRFNDVVPVTSLQYPEALPSIGELRDQLSDARSRADQAWTIAVAGIAVGVAGAGVGALALVRRRGVAA